MKRFSAGFTLILLRMADRLFKGLCVHLANLTFFAFSLAALVRVGEKPRLYSLLGTTYSSKCIVPCAKYSDLPKYLNGRLHDFLYPARKMGKGKHNPQAFIVHQNCC